MAPPLRWKRHVDRYHRNRPLPHGGRHARDPHDQRSVDRPWRELYEAWWRPEAFPEWASGLSQSNLERHGEQWKAEGPEGPIEITFTPHNAFGVMDHWVDLGDGREVYIPLRIIANGDGAEVQLTLFRQPDMSEAKFAEDQAWVKRDLLTLKTLSER